MPTNTLPSPKTKNNQDEDALLKGIMGWILFFFAPIFMAIYNPYFYFTRYNGYWFNLVCVYMHFFFVKKDKNDGWEWYTLIGYAGLCYVWIRYVVIINPGFFCFVFLSYVAMRIHATLRADEWIAKTENKEFQDMIERWLGRIFLTTAGWTCYMLVFLLKNVRYWALVYLGVFLLLDRIGWYAELRRSRKYNYPFVWH